MISTTFAAVVLSAALVPGAVSPSWQSDYGTALAAASAQQKPVAVFIGHGSNGYAKLVSGGQLPADAGVVLAKNYVCVYVDADTAAGKKLAGQFALTDGLVISSKGGDVQALRHAGTVTPTALTTYLTRYSEVKTVATTETVGVTVAPGVVPAGAVFGSCPNGRCPTSYTYPGTVTAPAYQYQSFPAFNSCPNGRCPNAR